MRLRTFVGLVAVCTIAGSVLAASSASAYQLPEPASAARDLVTQSPPTPATTTSTPVARHGRWTTAPCPLNADRSVAPCPS